MNIKFEFDCMACGTTNAFEGMGRMFNLPCSKCGVALKFVLEVDSFLQCQTPDHQEPPFCWACPAKDLEAGDDPVCPQKAYKEKNPCGRFPGS